MAIRFGKLSREDERDITLADLMKYPIWISRDDDLAETNPAWGKCFPVINEDPDITRQMIERQYDPIILCAVEGRKLYARASYWPKDRFIIGIEFWWRGKWIHQWDMKLKRPIILIPVAKILGKENVQFHLLSKKDIAAPRIGGFIHRVGLMNRQAILSKDLKIIKLPKSRWKLAHLLEDEKKSAPPKYAGVKFGRPKHSEKITLSDWLKHPIWVSAHDDERYDEEWYKPVTSPTEVSPAVLKVNHPVITFKVQETGGYGCGYYDHQEGELYGLSLFLNGKWKTIEDVDHLKTPLRLNAVPKIMGKPVDFILQNQKTGRAQKAR